VLLLDLNQVCIANLMSQLGNHTNMQLEESMLRHMILNSIRSYKAKFGREYGELIICCDSTNQWRKQYFPFYKANRKKAIEKSELDWKLIFDCLTKIRTELKEYSPYRVIDIPTAEADDIIATLVHRLSDYAQKNILILSSDKDFIQLHVSPNVVQFDPVRKKFLKNADPALFLREHILKGDVGDGVPNVLSPDNCLVVGQRQKPMTQKRIDELLSKNPDDYNENTKRNYYRNAQMIDLTRIPDYISDQVMTQFKEQYGKDRTRMYAYLARFKMGKLLESLGDFYIGDDNTRNTNKTETASAQLPL
jgi:hypothetical protein